MDNNKLPNGWEQVNLEDIAEQLFAGGDKPDIVSSERTEECHYPIYANGIKNKGLYGFTNEYRVNKDCITISARGTIGYIVLRTENFVPIVRLIVVIPTLYTLPNYLKYYMQTQMITDSGSSIPQLTIPMIKQLPIKLPPLNEQKRIVTKIEKLFSNLDKSDQHLAHLEKQLKRYRQSVLKSAFEGELTREWREKQTDLESADELLEKIKSERIEYIEQEVRKKFKDKTEKWIADKVKKEVDKFYNNLKSIDNEEKPFKIPNKWSWVRLDEVSLKIGDIDHKMPKSVENGYPYVATQNFAKKKEIDFNSAKQISKEDFDQLSKKIKPEFDDIIFPRYGTIGENILVNTNIDFLVSYSCAIIKGFSENVYNSKYNFLYSLSPVIKNEIKKYKNDTTQANVGIASIKLFLFSLPPLKEQEEIVKQIEKHFSIIDKMEHVVQKSINESNNKRNGTKTMELCHSTER